MKIFLFITIIFSISAFSQSDWQRWEKAEYWFSNPSVSRESIKSKSEESGENFFTAVLIKSYRFFISDVDGDNCPFRPSCSVFFVQAINETDFFQGTLMFVDRFTRDMNVFKGNNHYPRVKSGRYFDPPSLYTLNTDKIKYISASEIVSEK